MRLYKCIQNSAVSRFTGPHIQCKAIGKSYQSRRIVFVTLSLILQCLHSDSSQITEYMSKISFGGPRMTRWLYNAVYIIPVLAEYFVQIVPGNYAHFCILYNGDDWISWRSEMTANG